MKDYFCMQGFAKIQYSPKIDVNNKIQIVSGFFKEKHFESAYNVVLSGLLFC